MLMVAVPENFMKASVFLCAEQSEGATTVRIPRATGFLVRVDDADLKVDDLVTARHCVHEARAEGHSTLWLRANRKVGEFFEVPTRLEDWIESDEADVAAVRVPPSLLPLGVTPEDVDLNSIQLHHFTGGPPEYRYQGVVNPVGDVDIQPRVGHEVYFVGLFTEHYGQERNLPVARFGHIARMPSSVNIRNADGSISSVVAYLV